MKVSNATFLKSCNMGITAGTSLLFCYTSAIALLGNKAEIHLYYNMFGEGLAELFIALPLTVAASIWTLSYAIKELYKERIRKR
jgi:ABC-type sulfate transport system permease component